MEKKQKVKTAPLPPEQRSVLQANVKALIWDRSLGRELTPKEVEAKAKVSYKSVERILKADPKGGGPNVSTIYWLAHAFNADIWELLRPGFKPPLISAHNQRLQESPINSVILNDSAQRNSQGKTRK